MKAAFPDPIPIPASQRWRNLRRHVAPPVVFGIVVGTIALLWNTNVAAPTLVGQAEPVLSSLSSHKPGTVAMLNVVRFQKVRAGEILGQVLVAEPAVLESSLAVIRADLDSLKAGMSPVVEQQRNAVNYAQLRLDWMRQRADLASARVNAQLAAAELQRTEELFKSKLVSRSDMDTAQANHDALQQQVNELARLVAEGEINFTNMQPTGAGDIGHISNDPMRTAIAAQESKLQLTEAELAPVILRAPMDGIITAIYHRASESVTAGEPILAVASQTPVRIVGYLRAPNLDAARPGMKVRVRTRNAHRETALAQVTEVGLQLENPPAALANPLGPAADLGLPVEISLPENLVIRPGELLDLTLLADPS